jgi:hypothetical protein
MIFRGLKVYQGQKSIEDSEYSMETVLYQSKMNTLFFTVCGAFCCHM